MLLHSTKLNTPIIQNKVIDICVSLGKSVVIKENFRLQNLCLKNVKVEKILMLFSAL